MLTIYTDGACTAHDRHGGWGYIVVDTFGPKELEVERESGYVPDTTNNRMELMAILRGLSKVKAQCTVITDSRYAIGALTSTAGSGLNSDLVQQGRMLVKLYKPVFKWVRGHAGHRWNEAVDKLATEARDDGIPLFSRKL